MTTRGGWGGVGSRGDDGRRRGTTARDDGAGRRRGTTARRASSVWWACAWRRREGRRSVSRRVLGCRRATKSSCELRTVKTAVRDDSRDPRSAAASVRSRPHATTSTAARTRPSVLRGARPLARSRPLISSPPPPLPSRVAAARGQSGEAQRVALRIGGALSDRARLPVEAEAEAFSQAEADGGRWRPIATDGRRAIAGRSRRPHARAERTREGKRAHQAIGTVRRNRSNECEHAQILIAEQQPGGG